VLLERKQLTCGTTWHAAGPGRADCAPRTTCTRLAQYTTYLYASLEQETGQATGFRQTGSVAVATHAARLEELSAAPPWPSALAWRCRPCRRQEIGALWPGVNVSDLVGGVYLPKDGRTNPIDTTQALAKGARSRGARDFRELRGARKSWWTTAERWACARQFGDIARRHGGQLRRHVGRMNSGAKAGTTVPLHAAEHFYIVTEPMEGSALQPAGAARPRWLRLLQGRRGQAAGGLV
jgi:4-methylaminobutanoate oxidase (formaldehyde-forming)